ncbi:MAG: Holliday junction resolvase RuvX [Candidatus Doudnabacteria bacterium]|nr:Holliday junction resolvase RuvX [Candidatus Doudnabacteria bacterium]
MRILALDWGSKRVGAAISDEEGKIAFPMEHAIETKNATEEIKKIIIEHNVGRVLVGLPRSTEGSEGHSAGLLRKFASSLAQQTGIEITFLDERFTTVEATKLLRTQGLSEKKQRPIKDNLAAQIMLQRFLDTNSPV